MEAKASSSSGKGTRIDFHIRGNDWFQASGLSELPASEEELNKKRQEARRCDTIFACSVCDREFRASCARFYTVNDLVACTTGFCAQILLNRFLYKFGADARTDMTEAQARKMMAENVSLFASVTRPKGCLCTDDAIETRIATVRLHSPLNVGGVVVFRSCMKHLPMIPNIGNELRRIPRPYEVKGQDIPVSRRCLCGKHISKGDEFTWQEWYYVSFTQLPPSATECSNKLHRSMFACSIPCLFSATKILSFWCHDSPKEETSAEVD